MLIPVLIQQFHTAHFFPFFKALCKISLDNDTIDDSSEQNIKVQYGEDFEIQGNNNAGEEDGDVITISESLAKSHFPELLENSQEVYEISNTEGTSIELLMDSVFHRNGLLKFEQRNFFFKSISEF